MTDRALQGYFRHGFWRQGVYYPKPWDALIHQFTNITTPIPRIEVDGQPEMIVDGLPVYRVDVFTIVWEDMKRTFKKVS